MTGNHTPSPAPQAHRQALPWGLVLGLLVTFGLGLGSGWLIWGFNPAAASPTPALTIDKNIKRYDVAIDNNPTQGPENAPITIIEFSDYQCPYCIRWENDVFDRLMKDYNGKIRFVYRDFPLASIHPNATSAAEAADCAGEQGAYWPFHNALFSNQYGLGAEAYTKYATELGLNVDQFNQCVSERRYKDEVQADLTYAANLGIQSTPTFFVNGLALVGAQPYEIFKQVIDKELAGEIPK